MSQYDDRHPWVAVILHMWDTSVKDDESLLRATRLLGAVFAPIQSVALTIGAVLALATELHTLGWTIAGSAGVGSVATGVKIVRARRDLRRRREGQPPSSAESGPRES